MMKVFRAKNQSYDSNDSDGSSDSSEDEMNSVAESETGENSSKQTLGNRSRWDEFFGMGNNIASKSYSNDNEDSSHSSSSASSTSEVSGLSRMFAGKAHLSEDDDDDDDDDDDNHDDDDSEYDSDAENVKPDNLKPSRSSRQRKEAGVLNIQQGDGSSENISALTSSAFSDYINRINNCATQNPKAFTLIPIGNAAQAQYMILAPTSTEGVANTEQLLTPQSLRSVTLKQGMGNTATTSKKMKIYKSPKPQEKKFLNINPKSLEQKYDEFKERRRRAEEERREEKARRKEMEAEDETRTQASCASNAMFSESNAMFSTATCSTRRFNNDDGGEDMSNVGSQLPQEIPFVATMSRLFFQEDDDGEEAVPDNGGEKNVEQKNKILSSILKSRSRSIGKKKKEKAYEAVKESSEEGVDPGAEGGKKGLKSLLRTRSLSLPRGRSLKPFLSVLGSRSRSQSVGKSKSKEPKDLPEIKISSSTLSKIELERKKSEIIRPDITAVEEDVVKDTQGLKKTPMKALKNALKFKKRRGLDTEISIDTDPSASSMRKTMLAPNKIRSMIMSPVKKKEPSAKVLDEVMNEMVLYYYFGGDPKKSMEHVKKKEQLIPEEDSDEVLIRVEASTVSKTDCYVRHGRLWTAKGKDILPIVPGVDFVGEVIRCGEGATQNYGIQTNDRVAALIQTGGNSKYILEHANQLVQVPKRLKPAEAVVMTEVYLSAFQVLLFGVKGEDRYESRPLEGKEILILGGISTINQAMIELGVFLGAKEVYTTAVDKHVDFLREMGANVLDVSIGNWLPEVKGRMDIVVDSYCDDHYESPYKALNSNGKLICHGMQSLLNEEPGCITSLEEMWARTRSKYMSQTYAYDVYSYWEANLEESKADLAHLFRLLQKKAIQPVIADTVPLRKVPKAHSFLEAPRRIQGTFVCLPHSEG